jgi:hypothetical protein
MFYLNKDTELSIELLQKMINKFRTSVEPKLNKYKKGEVKSLSLL